MQRLLLRQYSPPAVVINAKGAVLHGHGCIGRFCGPAPGLGAMNVFALAREELSYELSAAVRKARATREPVVRPAVRLRGEPGVPLLRLPAQPLLHEGEPLAGLLLVVFEEQPTPRRLRQHRALAAAAPDAQAQALEKELQCTRCRFQTPIEEMKTSLEELKSTKEEAMTNKEELRHLNEALRTLNLH